MDESNILAEGTVGMSQSAKSLLTSVMDSLPKAISKSIAAVSIS